MTTDTTTLLDVPLKGPHGEPVRKSAPLGWLGWRPKYHNDVYGEVEKISVIYLYALVYEDAVTKKIHCKSLEEEEIAWTRPPVVHEIAPAEAYSLAPEEE
jgi:hypothetical protein